MADKTLDFRRFSGPNSGGVGRRASVPYYKKSGELKKAGSSVRTRKAAAFAVENVESVEKGTGRDPGGYEKVFDRLPIDEGRNEEEKHNVVVGNVEKGTGKARGGYEGVFDEFVIDGGKKEGEKHNVVVENVENGTTKARGVYEGVFDQLPIDEGKKEGERHNVVVGNVENGTKEAPRSYGDIFGQLHINEGKNEGGNHNVVVEDVENGMTKANGVYEDVFDRFPIDEGMNEGEKRNEIVENVENGTARAHGICGDVFSQLQIDEGKGKRKKQKGVVGNDGTVIVEGEGNSGGIERKRRGIGGNANGQLELLPISMSENGNGDGGKGDGDTFLDSLDAMSRTESLFMNCSVSGIGGMPVSSKSGSDPHVRDFMMGRFLPAAQAMASDSPQFRFRKGLTPIKETARIREKDGGGEPRRERNLILRYARELDVVGSCGSDGEQDECGNGGQFPRACGFLPSLCLKGNFGRLNPIPGMSFQDGKPLGMRTNAKIRSSSLGLSYDSHSWEDVYKLKMARDKRDLEDGSNFRSDSNELTLTSESPTAEGTLSRKNEALLPPCHGGKGFLGIPSTRETKSSNTASSDLCEKDGDNFWETASLRSGHLDSGSASPTLEKTVYVDSVNMLGTSVSESISFSACTGARRAASLSEKDLEAGMRNQRTEEGFVVDVPEKKDGNNYHKHYSSCDNLFPSENCKKNNTDPLQSLLPPLLPKTPSESWLSRALPSVASKNLTSQSLLAIGCQPKKQVTQAPILDQKQGRNAKFPKSQVRRIRFAEVLATPASPRSEI